MYIDKLDELINTTIHILTLAKKLMIKILNLKLVILLEYPNIKTNLQKTRFQIDQKKSF